MAKRPTRILKPIDEEVSALFLKWQRMDKLTKAMKIKLIEAAEKMEAEGKTASTFAFTKSAPIPDRDKISELWMECMRDIPFPMGEPVAPIDWDKAILMLSEDGIAIPTKPKAASVRALKKEADQ